VKWGKYEAATFLKMNLIEEIAFKAGGEFSGGIVTRRAIA
jgi:hypothetical protein